MNYDLDTDDGMRNAIQWVNDALGMLKTGGTWFVPRSSTMVTLVSRVRKQVHVVGLMPDPSLNKVLKAAGWEVT